MTRKLWRPWHTPAPASPDRGPPESPGEWADRPNHNALRRRNTRPMAPTLAPDATVAAMDIASPSIFARVAARVCARHLDRLVEANASPEPGSALEAHIVRLRSIGHREHLAAELRRRGIVVLCDRVVSLAPSRLNVPAVWDAAALIE